MERETTKSEVYARLELVVCLRSVAVAPSSQARRLWRAYTSDGRTVPAADVARALEAASEAWFLRSRGVDAAAMDEGLLEWRASGSVALDVAA